MYKNLTPANLKIISSVVFIFSIWSQGALADRVSIKQVLATKSSWNGTALPGFSSGVTEMRVSTFKLAPGAKTSIHVHPLNGAGYIISGELTMLSTKDPNGSFSDPKNVKEVTLKAGDAWAETVNTWHYGENRQKEDVEFVLVFSGQEGTPSTLSKNL